MATKSKHRKRQPSVLVGYYYSRSRCAIYAKRHREKAKRRSELIRVETQACRKETKLLAIKTKQLQSQVDLLAKVYYQMKANIDIDGQTLESVANLKKVK